LKIHALPAGELLFTCAHPNTIHSVDWSGNLIAAGCEDRLIYIWDDGGTLRHPAHPIVLATPDGVVLHAGAPAWLVEAKTARAHMAREWGPSETGSAPDVYAAQVTWQMACAGLPRADIAVLIGGDEFRRYAVGYDAELFGMLLECAERFWRDHVETDTPPAIDGSDACAQYLTAKHARESKAIARADAEMENVARLLASAVLDAKAAERIIDECQNRIKAAIGDCEAITGEGWRATWKTPAASKVTDWKAVAAECGATSEIAAKHTSERAASRRFLFSEPK
jgi:predicted phage-related endonuclease